MPRIILVDRAPDERAPDLAVYATDKELRPFLTAKVDERGGFELPGDALEKAAIIIVGGLQEKVERLGPEAGVQFRAAHFRELLKASDTIELARSRWESLLVLRRCVTGRVRRCNWRPWWFDHVLAPIATLRDAQPTSSLSSTSLEALRLRPGLSDRLTISPFPRCAKVCEGVVEVYLRTCCWRPIVIWDPRIPEIIDVLERLPELELPRFPPNPPDPPPFETLPFFKGGALDEAVINAKRDAALLRALPPAEQPAFIEARPYIRHLFQCGLAHKVGQGFIQPDGTFQVCWRDWPRLLLPWCHEEVAYVVKQLINGTTVTIYDGLAAGAWFGLGEEPTLTSWHPQAVGCRDGDVPGVEGAAIYLDVIGGTDAYHLKTPPAADWDRVAAPGYNDGLAFPAASAAAAKGNLLDRNWGGTLLLRWWFTEPTRTAGARYYRASARRSDASGNPTGPEHFLSPPGGAWQKLVFTGTGFDLVSEPLGVPPVGGQANLFKIPYDADLPASEEWRDGQFHAVLPTTDHAEGRWLLTLEVFDAAGNRLRPATGSGAGQPAPFRYLRWEAPGTPDVFTDVPFQGLTHMLWWDNRAGTGDILGLHKNGAPTTGECQFLSGPAGSTLQVDFIAHHPVEAFQLSHGITWFRGINGASGSIPVAHPFDNEGSPPATGALSNAVTFATLLGPHTKCSFAIHLNMALKTFNGSNSLFPNSVREVAAFALEIA